MQNLNYWERLKCLELYSLERRRERYIVIYIWKISQGLVPNIDGRDRVEVYENIRRGRLCRVPGVGPRVSARLNTSRETSFAILAPRLFNVLPEDLRNYNGSQDSFKNKLDRYLRQVVDQPSLPNYYQAVSSNSLLEQIPSLNRQ